MNIQPKTVLEPKNFTFMKYWQILLPSLIMGLLLHGGENKGDKIPTSLENFAGGQTPAGVESNFAKACDSATEVQPTSAESDSAEEDSIFKNLMVNGKKDGLWKEWIYDGDCLSYTHYRNGVKDGSEIVYPKTHVEDKSTFEIFMYRNGSLYYYTYVQDNVVLLSCMVKDNIDFLEEAKCAHFPDNGKQIMSYAYDTDGRLLSEEYDIYDELDGDDFFVDPIEVGVTIVYNPDGTIKKRIQHGMPTEYFRNKKTEP